MCFSSYTLPSDGFPPVRGLNLSIACQIWFHISQIKENNNFCPDGFVLTHTVWYVTVVFQHSRTPFAQVQPVHWHPYLFSQSCYLPHRCPASIASFCHSEPCAMFYSCPWWSSWSFCWPVLHLLVFMLHWHTVGNPSSIFKNKKSYFTLIC